MCKDAQIISKMKTLQSFLENVYKEINPERVISWITPDEKEDRGILRRLDFSYGFTKEDGNPMGVLDQDVNNNGLLQILKRHSFKNSDVDYIIQKVEETCKSIKELHYSFLVANYEEYYNNTASFLHAFYANADDPSNGLTRPLPAQTVFYRMRKMDVPANPKTCRIDFFHVPFTKRYLMGTYRYSIPGYPSLYSSSSVYCAWEEMGRQDVKDYGYIAFKTTNQMQLLDLCWRFDEEFAKDTEKLKYYILKLPIIIACSMQVRYTTEKFVPEYIFSQQIFQWLMSKLKKDTKNKAKTTIGVIYSSAKHEIWESLRAGEIKTADTINYALLAYISSDDITQYSKSLALKLNAQTPYWIEKRISAQKSPYDLLTQVQEHFTKSPGSYWKNMSSYIGDKGAHKTIVK